MSIFGKKKKPQPPPRPPEPPPIAMLNFNVAGERGDDIPYIHSDSGAVYQMAFSDMPGRCSIGVPTSSPPNGWGATLHWGDRSFRFQLATPGDPPQPLAGGAYEAGSLGLPPLEYAPPAPARPLLTLGELGRVRGAMWSRRWDGPYGPRPGRPDNILAMDYYEWYGQGDRDRMRAIYKAPGYTHAVTGPLVDAGGYHGQYPTQPTVPTQAQFDHYLDCMEEWLADGIVPVHFLHPDGWSFEETRDRLEALYRQPRARELLPIVIPSGWEPTKYEWSSVTWATFCKWYGDLNPDALIGIHTVSDVDAPVGTDGRFNDDDRAQNPNGNGGGWGRVCPYIHAWFVQNGPYPCAPAGDRELARNFGAQWKPDGEGAELHSIAWHFAGHAGWPTSSRWGNRPPLLINAECTAYESYWKNLPEGASQDWGDLAIASGADGYLDGGRVEVPLRR